MLTLARVHNASPDLVAAQALAAVSAHGFPDQTTVLGGPDPHANCTLRPTHTPDPSTPLALLVTSTFNPVPALTLTMRAGLASLQQLVTSVEGQWITTQSATAFVEAPSLSLRLNLSLSLNLILSLSLKPMLSVT